MAEPKRSNSKITFVIQEAAMPEQWPEKIGHFVIARDTGNLWYVQPDGRAVSLWHLLNQSRPVPAPQNGKDGRDGCAGAKGERGLTGATGGDGVRGPKGDAGRDGRDGANAAPCVCKTVEQVEPRLNAVEKATAQASAATTEHAAQIAELKTLVQGLIDRDTRSGEYITWLKERVAAHQKG